MRDDMSDLDADAETTEAIKALAWRLRNRSADSDPEMVAREYVWSLRNRGWRPTRARASRGWKSEGRPSSDPRARAAEARRRLAEATSVPLWCGSCGCPSEDHADGLCLGCEDCEALVEAVRSPETVEQDEAPIRTPKYHNADVHGRHNPGEGSPGTYSYPVETNTIDDSTIGLRGRYWRRSITDVHLPEGTHDQ